MRGDIEPNIIRVVADMHAVYRMFDQERRLLYVGRTGEAGQRFGDHSMKRWFPLVATIELEWYPTRTAAAEAERAAIIAEKPNFNITHRVPAACKPARPESKKRATRAKPIVRTRRSPVVATAQDDIPDGIRQEMHDLLAAGTTVGEVASVAGVTSWTARVWLERLRDEGEIYVLGSRRTAKWHAVRQIDDAAGGDG